MATAPDQIAHARDLFGLFSQEFGPITTGRMFSGTALYVEGDVMFACLLSDTIWMKSDAETRAAFEDAGSRPFTYTKATGPMSVPSLMSLPESALDDPEEALSWARLSYAPALKAAEDKRRQKARKAAAKAAKNTSEKGPPA